MKKRILSLISLFTILIVQINVYALSNYYHYDSVSEVANMLRPQIQNALSKELTSYVSQSEQKKISFMTVKNINFERDDSYQDLHNILQKGFPSREIVDVYINTGGRVFVPASSKPRFVVNELASCTDQDLYFKSLLNTLGVNVVYIVDRQNIVKLSSIYHNYIVNAVKNMYNKYIPISNGYINIQSNPLFTNLDMQKIDYHQAVAEFVGNEKVVHLSTDTFSNSKSNGQNIEFVTSYSMYHEMGHALEMALCKKVFKDLNLSNISPEGIDRLSTVAFEAQSVSVSAELMNTVLSKMNAPTDLTQRNQFISQNLTKYSTTNSAEFFAEAIASGFVNISNNRQISTLMDEEIKLFINKQGRTYQNSRESVIKFLKSECGIDNIY